MDPITTAIITGAIGMVFGVVSKIVFDWLRLRRGGNGYYYNGRSSSVVYAIKQEIALLHQTTIDIKSFLDSSDFKRLLEENHDLFEDRQDLKKALQKQNELSVETNVLLKAFKDELAKTTSQFAAVAEGLAAALKKIKEE